MVRKYPVSSIPAFARQPEVHTSGSTYAPMDEIPGVVPQRTDELNDLLGETFCAVIYDSDISFDFVLGEANLKGATSGILALKLLCVGEPNDEVLPPIAIEILDPTICQGAVPTTTGT